MRSPLTSALTAPKDLATCVASSMAAMKAPCRDGIGPGRVPARASYLKKASASSGVTVAVTDQ